MNERDTAELDRLLKRQEALQLQLTDLRIDIQQLSSRLNQTTQSMADIPPESIGPLTIASPEISEQVSRPAAEPVVTDHALVPPPLPPVIPAVATAAALPRDAETEAPRPFVPPTSPLAPVTRAPRETFEMKLGTYWLVRVGIVMLLTGLVFLGTYAYKNYIGKFGPVGKVTLLYSASAALLGFGGWLQRKREKESLRNYGQVLFAGGLAAVYFTTYAAHYVEVLRVIASPFVDALLLMGWAAATIWIADRRKSEVLALFAVALAYYTSAITDVGLFTLGSNLVLTAAAVFFLVRNRWTTLSFISVVATYGGFVFWRFHQGDWGWHARTTDLWPANFFLAGYWLFFTAAVFFARGKSLTNVSRALFASVNNGAFFALVLLSMMHMHQGKFWIFSLVFGSTLLGAAWLARKFLAEEPVVKNTYLVQGLTLVTLGFIAYFTGVRLALVLAAESVVLTFLGHQQKNLFVRAGGYVTAALSAAWVLTAMTGSNIDVTIGSVIGVAFLLNAWWEHRNEEPRPSRIVHPFSGYFIALAVGVCGIVTWHAVPETWRAVAWMIEAVAFTVLFYSLRVPALPIFSQALAVAAEGYWFLEFALLQQNPHWVVPVTFIGSVIALIFLGSHQKNIVVRGSAYLAAACCAAWVLAWMTSSTADVIIGAVMSAAFLLSAWWESRNDERRGITLVRLGSGYFVALAMGVCATITWRAVSEDWRAVAWMIEAVAFTALFYAVRLPELPLFSQALAICAQSYWFFEFALRQNKPHWLVPATLVTGTLALSHWWQRQRCLAFVNDMRNVLQIVYGLALVGVLFFWFQPSFGPAAWLAFLSMLAVGLTLYGVVTRAWTLAACAQLFLLISSVELYQQFFSERPGWQFALVPITTWLALGVATTAWLSRHDTRETVRRPLLQISMFYRGVAFLMSLWWIHVYVPSSNQFWVLCAVGLALIALGGATKNQEALVFSALYLAVAFALWFTRSWATNDAVNWANALAIIAVFAAQQIVRGLPARFTLPPHTDSVIILAAGMALWIFVSRWVVITSGAHFLVSVSWAALAASLFAAGFVLRERMHRWLGLGILAFAVGRVFFSDVWKLEPIYRILSFMALGIVLLALGFVYNKYQDKIRQWL